MQRVSAHYAEKLGMDEVGHLCELVTTVTTVRTIYQTDMNNLAPDGRIHPTVSMRQASGRWSVGSGFTVHGKHGDRKSTRLNSSHLVISYAVFCLKKKSSRRRPHQRLRGM